eukprot:CAMPEP_0119309978 /NCGR_PEP_ID=MMETSP1333-20130426/17629_1 /TAXON_ID=418940 /ORGANISM="Scyphosphaera apsteinii, Strain RCC1455" /LENGTH=542 /DNA_ID=CAMNT_0007314081 /DNA_START=23 /DNA_END=1651 /DNA_ORIENTATION=+
MDPMDPLGTGSEDGEDGWYKKLAKELETPKKDPNDGHSDPPTGPPEKWPIAFMPDGEDILGNGHVMKKIIKPGIKEPGFPGVNCNCKCHYTAYRMDGRQWDTSRGKFEFFHFIIGDLYTNRLLEAAAASMHWGEIAEFVCTIVYAQGNNGTQRKIPKVREGVVRYEVELYSWKDNQIRFQDGKTRYDLSSKQKYDMVVMLKERAAMLIKCECWEDARERYKDCRYYLEEDCEPPPGEYEEYKALMISVWLNEALCAIKLTDFRHAVEMCNSVLHLDPVNVKALYRRGMARNGLHDFSEAQDDLNAAARQDPKSREVRTALAEVKQAEKGANKLDGKFFSKSIGKKELYGKNLVISQSWDQVDAPPVVYFEIQSDKERWGRIVFQLFVDGTFKTSENFRALCTGEKGKAAVSGLPLHFKGNVFHRVIKGFMVQAGDITRNNGTGGVSIYGGSFSDESFSRKHDHAGLLSMANCGRDSNTSQFFITTAAAHHLDNEHVVFGRVVEGMEVVLRIQEAPVDAKDRPLTKIVIADSGQLHGAVVRDV